MGESGADETVMDESEADETVVDETPAPTFFPSGSYRRRIRLVASAPGVVEGGLEDDIHYFTVTVRHDGERVLAMEGGTVREPWSTCHEAAGPLRSLEGMPLSESCVAVGDHGVAVQNCTHMFDLAGLAVAHAWRVTRGGAARRQYDIEVPHRAMHGGEQLITLFRDGEPALSWTVDGLRIVAPEPFAQVKFTGGFFRWAAATLPPDEAEAAIVLRRACTIGMVRGIDLDQHDTLQQLPELAPLCYSMQPERAPIALRRKGQIRDYDADPDAMLAEGPT